MYIHIASEINMTVNHNSTRVTFQNESWQSISMTNPPVLTWPVPGCYKLRDRATARPPVAASAGALTLAGSPSIRAFVAKSILSRFARFWMYHFQPQCMRFCCEIRFVAIYSFLVVPISAIHGDD